MKLQEKSFRKRIEVKLTFLGGFEFREKVIEVEEGKTYSDILEDLGINPETVIVVRETDPVPIDSKASEGEVKVLRVISGGNAS